MSAEAAERLLGEEREGLPDPVDRISGIPVRPDRGGDGLRLAVDRATAGQREVHTVMTAALGCQLAASSGSTATGVTMGPS